MDDRDELIKDNIIELLEGIRLAYENDPEERMRDMIRDRVGANGAVYYSLAAIYDAVSELIPEDPDDDEWDDEY